MNPRFRHVLRAEWTKFRSVRSHIWAAVGAIGLTAVFGVLMATPDITVGSPLGSTRYVHQPLDGDGTIIARVVSQEDISDGPGGPQAKAGLMLRARADQAEPYAAIMATPWMGVRMQANFRTDLAGRLTTLPVWLKLTRTGDTVTGYESADGTTWAMVGSVTLTGLPRTVQVGLFSAAAAVAGNVADGTAAAPSARLDNVSRPGPWTHADTGQPEVPGTSLEADGIFLVAGSGDLWYPPFETDRARSTLLGVLLGVMVMVAVAVRFVTSENANGMLRTSLAATPRRGRVLAAKAIVVGAIGLLVGLVGALTAYLGAAVRERYAFVPAKGMPPLPSLADPALLRALVGTGALLAVVLVLALAAGVIIKRPAGAITLVIGAVVLPPIVALSSPPGTADPLLKATPAAGLAIQQTTERVTNQALPVGPWVGFAILCAWALVTVAVAHGLLRRRDA